MYTWKISVSMRKCNKGHTLKSVRKELSEEVTIWTDNLKDEKESIRWVISEELSRQRDEQVQSLWGRKGLNVFSKKLKRGQVVKRLWTCLRWGWSSRQGLTSHIWKPQGLWVGQAQDPTTLAAFGEWPGGGKHRIRNQSGDYLGGSGDLWSVAVVMGEKWIYLRHKLEVTLIGLSDRDVGRWQSWFLRFCHEQLKVELFRVYLSEDSVFWKYPSFPS